MKFFTFCLALTALFLFCGCLGPVLVVGEFCPMRLDEKGIPYVYASSRHYNEIRYKGFSFDWKDTEKFRIYPHNNNPFEANWSSELADASKMHTIFGMVERQPHYLTRTDQEALRQYAERCYTPVPFSKLKILKRQITTCTFKDQPAVKVYYENYEAQRDLYTHNTIYMFPCPISPKTHIYFVSWSERSKKEDFKKSEVIRQGEAFFKNFRLHPAEKD
ncbi:MAG: hypothetical protein E7058_00525 [Lentisphaerae bacterium]|nr:hypothetical protein [Lentisphaerota bacterium]